MVITFLVIYVTPSHPAFLSPKLISLSEANVSVSSTPCSSDTSLTHPHWQRMAQSHCKETVCKPPRANSVSSEAVLAKPSASTLFYFFPSPSPHGWLPSFLELLQLFVAGQQTLYVGDHDPQGSFLLCSGTHRRKGGVTRQRGHNLSQFDEPKELDLSFSPHPFH